MDIKETSEVLDGIIVLLEQYQAAMEDGSIGFFDIPKLVPIFSAIKLAIEGIALVPAEVVDIDQTEVVILFGKVSTIASKISEILKKKE